MATRLARGSRAAARVAGIAAAAAERDQVDVLGLDAEATLATITEARAAAQWAQVVEARAVAHWADQHRVVDPEDWAVRGGISADGRAMLEDLTHQPGGLGTEGVLRLAGEGAFAVREFAVTDLAVTLGLSEQGARDYVGQVGGAARPAPAVVGAGDGGAVAGVEGPPGRRADHPAERRSRGLRRRPARRVRPPAVADPDQPVCGGGDHPLSARPRRASRRGGCGGPRCVGL